MHFIYIDDSQDQSTGTYAFSALAVPAELWREMFGSIRDFRRAIRDSDGIFVTKELHAWKFVSGRGRISNGIVTKSRRCEIFVEALHLLAKQEGLRLFSVAMRNEGYAFERLLNRINRTMLAWKSRAILVCDEGKEGDYTRLARKMGVYNPIPSRYGTWQDGASTRNIPIEHILEDPFFKNSERSYFIQMADFCAYALLRKECPIPSKTRYGLDKAFIALAPICVRAASPRDPYGIVR